MRQLSVAPLAEVFPPNCLCAAAAVSSHHRLGTSYQASQHLWDISEIFFLFSEWDIFLFLFLRYLRCVEPPPAWNKLPGKPPTLTFIKKNTFEKIWKIQLTDCVFWSDLIVFVFHVKRSTLVMQVPGSTNFHNKFVSYCIVLSPLFKKFISEHWILSCI